MNHHLHHPSHWLAVAAVAALALLASEASGQGVRHNTNAQAVFEGRPAMAGAQAGLGAMAGPPQGGIGVQGSDGAGLQLRRPQVVEQQVAPPPLVTCADSPRAATADQPSCQPEVRAEAERPPSALLRLEPEVRWR